MNKERCIGIDLIRFLSMLSIIILHVINFGGVLNKISVGSYKYFLIIGMLIIAFTSVNIFGIMSGYLNVNKKNVKYKRIIELIMIVFFYCFLTFLIFYGFNLYNVRNLGIKSTILNLFPILDGCHWYIVSYVLLFFLIPYINIFIKNINIKQYKKLLLVLFIFFCVIPNIFGMVDLFRIKNGYSPFWLLYLYLIGGYIRLYFSDKLEITKIIKYSFLIYFITFVINMSIRLVSYKIFGYVKMSEWFINYISPFNVILSILLFLIFIEVKIKNKSIERIITKLSGSSFSVYISHGQKLICSYILIDLFNWIYKLNGVIALIVIALCCFLIYILFTIIDEIRLYLFKLLKINILIEKIGNKLEKKLSI